jgi:hypothetical protein
MCHELGFLCREQSMAPSLPVEGGAAMTEPMEKAEQRSMMQKAIALKDDGYYSNCSMVEATPFDISILFGKIRPRMDDKGQASLVEVYERQVYLSHLQARALFEALGRSLNSSSPRREPDPSGPTAQKQ